MRAPSLIRACRFGEWRTCVADRATMSKVVLGNTNAPAITIGEDRSDLILEDARAGMFACSA